MTRLPTLTYFHPVTSGKTLAGFLCRGGLLALGLAVTASGMVPVPMAPLKESDESIAHNIPTHRLGDDELITEEVFQSHLPTTLEKDGFRLSVHPHLGDWLEKDHLRMTTSLRYGLTDNCEISASSNLYFSHGHGDIPAFRDNGAANLKVGAKFDLGQILFTGWETGAGFDYEVPAHHPAPELTDGMRHLRTYVTLSHRLESHRDLRIFGGFRADIMTKTDLPGEFGKNAFHESWTGLTGGMVIDRENWHYTLELSWDTTRLTGDSKEDIYSIRPGVLWEIPARHHPQLRSNWMIGCSLNETFGPGGNSIGASFKVRYNRDLKQPIHRARISRTR